MLTICGDEGDDEIARIFNADAGFPRFALTLLKLEVAGSTPVRRS
jgi:hypothetical protein